MAHDTLMLFTQLSGFRLVVLAKRLGCDSDLARRVHDGLAAALAEMIEAQRRVLAAESAVVAARGTPDEQDACLDLHHYLASYHERWLMENVALLDEYLVDNFTCEYFDFRSRQWHHRDSDTPFVVPVPSEKLCGLASTIAEIEDCCGVRFSVDRVCYSEAEAEATWWELTGADPELVFG